MFIKLNKERQVVLHWLRAHVDIRGNEIADKLAKKALNSDRLIYSRLSKEVVLSNIIKFLEH